MATGAFASSIVLLAACGGSGKSTSSVSTSRSGTSAASALSNPPGSSEISPGVVSYSSGSVAAKLHAATHHPHVGKPWPIAFVATDAGKPAHAEVAYEYLFGGQVVAHRSHYKFMGSFHDIFKWPASAVGFPLTFRAVITSGGATLNLDYPVQVVG